MMEEGHGEYTGPVERARLLQLCRRLTGDREAAEDLVQETLLEAWRHEQDLREAERRFHWLCGIARNVCLRWLRKRGRELERIELSAANRVASLPDGADLELELERGELACLLDRALALLPPETRDVLIGRYIEELSTSEIAARSGLQPGMVAVRLHRGKLALQRVLMRDFPNEVAEYGFVRPESAWQVTRIWCPLCGKRRFVGHLDSVVGAFELWCPECGAVNGTYTRYESTALFNGLKGYKAAFNRAMGFVGPFYQQAVANRGIDCPNCDQGHMLLSLSLPSEVQPSSPETRGMSLRCDTCLSVMSMRLSNLVLYQPSAWEFWRRHPRIHLLPERSIEVDGHSALVLSYLSPRDSARLEVVVASGTYEIVSIHQTPAG